jgi:hypothetical protein
MSYDATNGTEMDTSDSRKRPLDGETDNGVSKRSNQGGETMISAVPDQNGATWQSADAMQGQMGSGEGDACAADGSSEY